MQTSPEEASTDATKPGGIEPPPTVGLLAIIIFCAAIAAQLLTPGAFQREDKTVKRPEFTVQQHTVQPGETIESIREQYGAVATAADAIFLANTTTVAHRVTAGQQLELRVYRTRTRSVVVPGTYAPIERDAEASSLLTRAQWVAGTFLLAPIMGFQDKADVIAFILIIGGVFGIIMATGAINAGLNKTVSVVSGTEGARYFVIPIVMLAFSLGGAVFGLSEEVIPFVLITVPLALRLGYDTITGLCMSFVAAGLGFAGAFLNPFTVGVAQAVAEVTPASGMGFRVVVWAVVTTAGISYTMWWANRVRARPELSPTHAQDRETLSRLESQDTHAHSSFTTRDGMVLATLAGTILVVAWGVKTFQWYMEELSAAFFCGGLVAAVAGGLKFREAANSFARGASDLSGAAIVVAFAAGIVYVLNQGQVLDTLLNSIANSLDGVPTIIAAWLMFVFQTLLNVVVPSGSGQAAMTMPIMAPLSDLLGISRQTAVLAYQFGDGFGNMVIPTSAVTMSVLGIARVPWTTWFKWMLPLQGILIAIALTALAVAVSIGYH